MKKTFSILATLAVPFALAGFPGCPNSKAPDLVISSNPSQADFFNLFPYDFGNVAVTTTVQKQFVIKNKGGSPAQINDVSTAAFQLKAPFSLVELFGAGDCKPGIKLGKDETCTFTIIYSPTETVFSNNLIKVSYVATDTSLSQTPRTASKGLTGKGILDCTVPALSPSRDQGVQAAQDQMAEDAIQGAIDGAALTRDQGIRDGYNDTYRNAYNAAYNSAQGYPAGYNAGLVIGRNNQQACNAGTNDGYTDGLNDGGVDGQYDGYHDGYDYGYTIGAAKGEDDGYSDGYSDGWDRGITAGSANGDHDGYNACYKPAYDEGYRDGQYDASAACNKSGSATTKASKANFEQACFDQGFDATYSTSSYWNAYNDARAHNAEYQSGLAQGRAQGTAEGTADGKVDGYNAGLADGKVDGANERYTTCYNDAYSYGYSVGYSSGYNAGYSTGYGHGQTDGYNVGYNDGYDSGDYDGYRDAYNSAYQAGYTTGCRNGDSAGYTAGYYAGWDSVTCVNKSLRPTLMLSRSGTKSNQVKPKSNPKAGTTAPHGKRYHGTKATPLFGKDQSWWKMINGRGSERFVGARLPKRLLSLSDPKQGPDCRAQSKGLREVLKRENQVSRSKAVNRANTVSAPAAPKSKKLK